MRPITPDRVKLLAGTTTIRSFSSAGKILMLCNILLALYNFMCFSVPRTQSEPCVVVLNDSELHMAAQKGILHVSEVALQSKQQQQQQQQENSVVPEEGEEDTVSLLTQEDRGDFVVLANYVRARGAKPEFDKSVTYTTQATHEFFFPHIGELCERWQGPISVAVYAPGSDFGIVNRKLAHLIQCNPCVAANVSFHIIYHRDHTPPNIPDEPEKYVSGLIFDCNQPPNDTTNYRKLANLTYPINVLRNVARLRAETKYILASDIELYPSTNIIPRFIKFMETAPKSTRIVYTLPIFEVEKGHGVPRSKSELQKLHAERKAIFFHRYVCDTCQNFPNREKWIHQNETTSPALNVFQRTKRRRDRSSWEPIYIGTNEEPLYAEQLTWEGKRDKMSQMFELCLMDYDFHILNDAFLCHAPGIKRISHEDLAWRSPFVKKNNSFYPKILSDIKKKHTEGIRREWCE